MTSEHWSIRKTARRQEQVARLGRTTGLDDDFSAVVDYALAFTISRQEAREMDARMTTNDRVRQVDWLREFAGNIASNLGEGTAEELVEYALSDDGRESWGIELPEWFSDHDKRLLIEWVEEACAH
jgi:predicted  nucleic acid-binding Zn-ribbon protein